MRNERLLYSQALIFFLRFLFFSAALSLAWETLSGPYLQTLVPAVNALLKAGLPPAARLDYDGQWMRLALVGTDQVTTNLRFTGYRLLHLQAVAGIAFFAACPGLGYRTRAAWMGAVAALLWFSQVWVLYEGICLVLAEYGARLPTEERVAWRRDGWPTATGPGPLYAWWNTWGGPVLVLLLWMATHWQRLKPEGLRAEDAPQHEKP